jgi:hypothetical protein
VNSGLQACITTLKVQDGPLTLAQWQVTSCNWDYSLVISRVYRSPNSSDTASLEAQFTQIESFMSAPPAHPNAKYDVSLMMGDFNAKIGEEKQSSSGLPPRLGY